MDILIFIKNKVSKYSAKELRELAVRTGVPHGTLQKIKSGETDNPRIKTVQPLYNALLPRDRRHKAHP